MSTEASIPLPFIPSYLSFSRWLLLCNVLHPPPLMPVVKHVCPRKEVTMVVDKTQSHHCEEGAKAPSQSCWIVNCEPFESLSVFPCVHSLVSGQDWIVSPTIQSVPVWVPQQLTTDQDGIPWSSSLQNMSPQPFIPSSFCPACHWLAVWKWCSDACF